MSILPEKSRQGFYEIRLESIGGLGANLAGKMLAEAGVLGNGLNGSNFSSYGSEKKGTPVKSFVRFSDADTEIRDHSPVEEPHIIGVFHEALYKMMDVTKGLRENGTVLVNSVRSFEEIKEDLKFENGTIALVDALGIALDEKTKVNTAMLGALFRICDFLDPEYMKTVIRRTFEKKYPHLVESNIRTFERGYREVQFKTYQSADLKDESGYKRSEALLGYQTQLIGGTIMAQGNSMLKDVSASRQGFLPELDKETCIHCAACDSACPDMCFVWQEREDKRGRKMMFLSGIDYQYCKGCLKCVEACPTGSLKERRESTGYADEHRVNQLSLQTIGGEQ